MTVLEDEQVTAHIKLSSKRLHSLQNLNTYTGHKYCLSLKRKNSDPEDSNPLKRHILEEMLNGYRASDTVVECPVATLSNVGNTCFLNSVLYTLRFAPTFLHNLHHLIGDLALVTSRLNQSKAKSSSLGRNVSTSAGPSSRSVSSKDLLSLGNTNDIIPKPKVQVVSEKLHELFMTMRSLELKESSDAYQPLAFLQAVREANYIFEGNHQQDAHELLVYLLDNIRETCDFLAQQVQHHPEILHDNEMMPLTFNNKLWSVRCSWKKGKTKKDKSTKDSITEEQTGNGSNTTDLEDARAIDGNADNGKKKLGYNFVAEDFEGVTLRRTRCLECESVSERKEPFYDIPVPISFKDEDCDISADEIYKRACVTSEKLCDSNKYLCENCRRYNEASREVSFEKLPNIMVLQLKRFTTTAVGVQKVNSYLPTPLELACFCEKCCQVEPGSHLHRYQLCCVIMHLGATMASGHYIAYVKASDHFEDYADCPKDVPKSSLSAGSSEKSLNILKFLKPRALSGSLLDNKLASSKNGIVSGVGMCKSIECCGIRLNKNVVENVLNTYTKRQGHEKWQQLNTNAQNSMWLECDDENVRPLSSQEFEDLLSYKPNLTSTPYLLFYSKLTDFSLNEYNSCSNQVDT